MSLGLAGFKISYLTADRVVYNNKKNKRNNKPKTDVVVKIEGGKAPGNPKQQGKARAKKQLATKKPRPTNPKPLEDLVRNILSQDLCPTTTHFYCRSPKAVHWKYGIHATY